METVLVLGAGAWGTALAIQLSRNHHKVYLWGRDAELIQTLVQNRQNRRYLPEIALANNIHPISSLNEISPIEQVVIATPCVALKPILDAISHFDLQHICLSCKGFEAGTGRLSHEIVQAKFNNLPAAVLSGPSFSTEVGRGMPTAVTIAANTLTEAKHFSELFRSTYFRTYMSDDLIGVQIGGAIKNVMAIAVGLADGLGLGINARSALITRGLKEITQFGMAMGAKQETFLGLSGIGDLVLTCTDDQSRNRRLGLALASGLSQQAAMTQINQTIEGIKTAKETDSLADLHNIDMPITRQVTKILNQEITPREAVEALLLREPNKE